MSSSTIQWTQPMESKILPLTTSGKFILRRRQVEILPVEQTEFKYDGNDTIIFNISSQSECLDGLDSHVRLNFLATGNAERVLDVGGAHTLFKEMIVRTVNGTLIQRIQNYNRFYAMMSMANHSPQHVELVEAAAGDSVDAGADVLIPYKTFVNGVNANPLVDVPFAVNAVFDHAGGLGPARSFRLGAGSVGGLVVAGDELIIAVVNTYNNGNGARIRYETYYATVLAAVGANGAVVITIGDSDAGDNNVPPHGISGVDDDNRIIHISKFQRNPVAADLTNVYLSQRASVARSAAPVTLTFKPLLQFLGQKSWIPLMLIRQGIALEMKLERPEFAMSKNQAPAAQNDAVLLAYTISKPRYVATMITPNEVLTNQYKAAFNAEGLEIPFVAYDHVQNIIDQKQQGTISLVMKPGVRSAKHVFGVIQSSRISQDVSRSSLGNYSLSNFFRSGLTSYQYKSGGEQYPDRPVNCDNYSSEVFNQLMLSTGQHSGTIWSVRFSPSDWRNENTLVSSTQAAPNANVNLTNRSTKFIMSTVLGRDSTSFTGVDLSTVSLDLELNFDRFEDDAFGNRILHTWVGFDTTVSISSMGFIIKK